MIARLKKYWMPLAAIAIFAICLVTSAIRQRSIESEMAFLSANHQSLNEQVAEVYADQSEPDQIQPDQYQRNWVKPARHDEGGFFQDESLLASDQFSSDRLPPIQALPNLAPTDQRVEAANTSEPILLVDLPVFNEETQPEPPATVAAQNVVIINEFVEGEIADPFTSKIADPVATEIAAPIAKDASTFSAQDIAVVELHESDSAVASVALEAAESIERSNNEPNDPQLRLARVESSASDPSSMFKPAKANPDKLPVPGGKSKLPKLGGKSKAGDKKAPVGVSSINEFKLAAQPELGAHFKDDRPLTDPSAHLVEDASSSNFSPGPSYDGLAYEPFGNMNVYQGKTLNANQRPLVELGRPWYQLGQLSPGSSVLGFHNNVNPQFIIFGDSRVAYASNTQNGDSVSQIATALNLDLDLKITATERFHAFISPNSGSNFTRWLLDDDEMVVEADANFDFAYFEGDLGAIAGGFMKKTLPFDLPFAVGVMPLFFQNGVWMNDALLGVAVTIPARNSAKLDISNMDITFFAGYDKISSDAFPGDDSAARIFGMASFIEALNGYFEIDYAFLDDRTFDDRSYHNIGIGYTRRWGRFLSNSTRVIVNTGQSTDVVENTADGVLLLSENSLITGAPSTVVPYMNFFAGFDRPQSAARAGIAGGVLNNTGILFESDNLTGYPTLDSSANDTYGMAMGTNLLASDFSQQLIVEAAMLGVMGDDATRKAKGDQYGVGVRYQLPLTNSIIFRADAMKGFLRGDDDVHGVRMELRKKF